MRKVLSLIIIGGLISPLEAGPGTTSASFLRMGAGGRPLALAGAYTALGNDAQSLFWNPAGIYDQTYHEASLSHQELGEGMRQQSLSVVSPLKGRQGVFGSTLILHDVGDVQGYRSDGVASSKVRGQDLAASAAYALAVRRNLRVGFQAKYISQKLDSVGAAGWAGDLGVLYVTPIKGLRLGASALHYGPSLKFADQSDPLPSMIKIGAAYGFTLAGGQASLACDGSFLRDNSRVLNAGIEYVAGEMAAFRVGYQSDDDLTRRIRFGVGLLLKKLSVDYAYLPRGIFDDAHRMSLSYRFGKNFDSETVLQDIDRTLGLGKQALARGEYMKAHAHIESVLELQPGNLEAQEAMAMVRFRSESALKEKQTKQAMAQAVSLYKSGEIAAAKSEFKNVLSMDPNHLEAKSYIHRIEQRFDEIVESFIDSAKKSMKQEQYEKAIVDLKKILAFKPEHREASEWLITAVEQLISPESREPGTHNMDFAIQNLKELLAIQPDNKRASDLLNEVTDQQRKIEDYTLQEKIKRIFEKGMAAFQQHRYEPAKREFEAILALKDDHKEARKMWEASVTRMNQGVTAALLRKSMRKLDERNWAEAMQLLELALKYSPNNADATALMEKAQAGRRHDLSGKITTYYLNSASLYSEGKYEAARDLLVKLLKLDPEHADAKRYLEKIELILSGAQ